MAKEEVEFYDVKTKKKFKTTEYRIVEKVSESKSSGKKVTRYFAVAKSLEGPHECWRVVGKDFADKNK
ncbi:hypothetical protein B6U91_00935 [Candidatus Pacearchaeota archaeon ex4484_71]|nr:MAG: hypothetical protein B6U91_00935 [Candidatus Pacearchaeota archaeon ex4484_71]